MVHSGEAGGASHSTLPKSDPGRRGEQPAAAALTALAEPELPAELDQLSASGMPMELVSAR